MEKQNYLEMYLNELKDIVPCDEHENSLLVKQLFAGGEDAKMRLIEGNLHIVPERVLNFGSEDAPIEDLIQEGNMAVVGAVDEFVSEGIKSSFTDFVTAKIDNAIEKFMEEEGMESLSKQKLEDETNRLLSITKTFEEENGRTATLSELAKLMGLSEDETERIMRISYNAMTATPKENQ